MNKNIAPPSSIDHSRREDDRPDWDGTDGTAALLTRSITLIWVSVCVCVCEDRCVCVCVCVFTRDIV